MAKTVMGLSISYQRTNLLARGLGLEHLRELLVSLARPPLRQGASVAYAGHWMETEDNFTLELLRLISAEQAEQDDNGNRGQDPSLTIGRLYNHSAWPHFLDITPAIEARWINSCRIVRVTQQLAGIGDADTVPDSEANSGSNLAIRNAAICLSAMRKLSMDGMQIAIPDVPSSESVPPIMARIVLGGRIDGFTGFLPGIFEESLVTLERYVPLYILGGFGGAAELLTKAFIAGAGRPKEFTVEWQKAQTPALQRLEQAAATHALPSAIRTTAQGLDQLFEFVEKARLGLSNTLHTGLSDGETRELLETRDMNRAVHLVLKGLAATIGLETLPA
jgi:hypothetical protein